MAIIILTVLFCFAFFCLFRLIKSGSIMKKEGLDIHKSSDELNAEIDLIEDKSSLETILAELKKIGLFSRLLFITAVLIVIISIAARMGYLS